MELSRCALISKEHPLEFHVAEENALSMVFQERKRRGAWV
jgi:hypothetical protein